MPQEAAGGCARRRSFNPVSMLEARMRGRPAKRREGFGQVASTNRAISGSRKLEPTPALTYAVRTTADPTPRLTF
jgi:hypothetical protein